MEYLQESGASILRRRRRRRAAITLTLVAVSMLGTFAYAAAYFQGWVGARVPETVASPACQVVTPAKALTPSAVMINVYNATSRNGLAASVAKSLRTQGFKVLEVANDPLAKQITGVGEVRHGQAGRSGALLAVARLPGAKVVADKRPGDAIDLVLGDRFTALRAPRSAAPVKAAAGIQVAIKATPSPVPAC